MTRPTVAVLHPGQMGAAVAAQIQRTDIPVLWCPRGRSDSTVERATAAGLEPRTDLAALLAAADIVVSICPPEFAEDLASSVAGHQYAGVYVDANAISPQRCQRIEKLLVSSGARFIDASIIGPPPSDDRPARMYLAGARPDTADVANLFVGTAIDAVEVDNRVGSASALKMAFASYQKSTRTLSAVAHALASRHDVTQHLLAEASRTSTSPLADPGYIPSVAARAWRWAPEMNEIADTLTADGIPADLATATATVLAAWADDKDAWDLPLNKALDRLTNPEP